MSAGTGFDGGRDGGGSDGGDGDGRRGDGGGGDGAGGDGGGGDGGVGDGGCGDGGGGDGGGGDGGGGDGGGGDGGGGDGGGGDGGVDLIILISRLGRAEPSNPPNQKVRPEVTSGPPVARHSPGARPTASDLDPFLDAHEPSAGACVGSWRRESGGLDPPLGLPTVETGSAAAHGLPGRPMEDGRGRGPVSATSGQVASARFVPTSSGIRSRRKVYVSSPSGTTDDVLAPRRTTTRTPPPLSHRLVPSALT
ncbi:hypothetical protein DCS_04083 [Drechmeria coniospora]|uniref:Uncharacterized protein n=1 Tax=Drechmeria coniospora TaxID=98403 RepID=A0A151GJ12_DRECN|nr:hypothetical protein DCS_04083 [Drechmeria coniospora]KYK57076.1 hypothetical protein DCS_04083 [Drechmeria coniospora]